MSNRLMLSGGTVRLCRADSSLKVDSLLTDDTSHSLPVLGGSHLGESIVDGWIHPQQRRTAFPTAFISRNRASWKLAWIAPIAPCISVIMTKWSNCLRVSTAHMNAMDSNFSSVLVEHLQQYFVLKELFQNVDATTIVNFINEINFYHLV